MDSPFFFPQVIGWKRKPCGTVPVRCEEISAPNDHVLILPDGKFYVPELVKMMPERPEDKTCAIFLYRQFFLIATYPWMPGTSEGTVRIIFMEKISYYFFTFTYYLKTKIK